MIHTQVLSSLINSQIVLKENLKRRKPGELLLKTTLNIITNFKKYNKKNGSSV